VAMRIDRKTGEPVRDGAAGGNTETEVFRKGLVPGTVVVDGAGTPRPRAPASGESLF